MEPQTHGESLRPSEKACSQDAAQLSSRLLEAALDPSVEAQDSTLYTIDKLLEAMGFGRFHVMLMVICGMGWFMVSVEVDGLAYIYVELDTVWGTTPEDWGLLNSVQSCCSLAGSLGFGIMADKCGRRPAFVAALAVTVAGGLASAASPNFLLLLALRAVTNLGAGGFLPAAISLLVEHTPPSVRESCLALMQVFFVSGHIFAVVASMFLPSFEGRWRVFTVIMALPAALLLLSWRAVPESPQFLHRSGDEAGAREALAAMCRISRQGPDIVRLPGRPEACPDQQGSGPRGFLRLCTSRRILRQTMLHSLLWSLTNTASDYTNWMTELGHARGYAEHSVEGFMIACKAVGALGFLVAAACALGGRGRPVLCAGFLGGALASAAATVAASVRVGPALLPASVVVLYFPYDVVWGLLYAITASSFDSLCRASALSMANSLSSAAAIAAPLVSGAMLMGSGLPAMCFWTSAWTASACLSCAMFCRCRRRRAACR